ncbi:MAG: PKD domain-containing protein, partial [Chitinophagaceae bacterium]|nr:PKD domain-containing protein [Chitinophagaceae bacterium]
MSKYLIVFTFLLLTITAFSQTITPAGPHTICPGASINLTASAGGSSYQWKKDGTDIGGATAQSYLATQAGTYTVAITTNGNTVVTSGVVVSINNLAADFTSPAGTPCASSVQLNGSATGGTAPYTYAWTFGGGGTSTTQNPLHNFNAFGCAGTINQTATLTVTDAKGCSNTRTKTITMLPAPDISLEDVNFPFSPFNNCNNNPSPANPNFSITAKINSASPCASNFTIDWGDGSPAVTGLTNGATRTHTYNTIGVFTMTLTANGAGGCQGKKTYTVANQSNPDIGIGTTGTTIGCADLPVNIQINLWQGNSAGTTYLLEYGDGQTLPMTHPINATNSNESITHTYTSSSCATTGGPSYNLKITATNACNSKVFQGGNITVYTKPIPDFGNGPACMGQPTCFTDQSIAGYNANCTTNATYLWNFDDPGSGSNNTSNQPAPCHTFTTPGNHNVKLTVTNGCGSNDITKTVCVNPATTSAFTVDDNDVCIGSTVTTQNTSSLGSCVSAGYLWDVTYASGFCGTTPGWSFASGTSTSATPSFKFTNPGTYTIRLRITGACGNSTSQQTVLVKDKPKVTLNPIANVCGQTSITPAATYTNCGATALTYSWKMDGTELSTIANPPSLAAAAGTHTLSLSATNECGSTVATQNFSNNTGANLTVPANAIICGGETTGAFNFTTAPTAPVTWTNNHPEIGLPANGTGNIAAFAPVNNTGAAIVATITATATLNNCPNTKTFTITVNPKPAAPGVVTPVNYCDNQTAVPLTATVAAGHQLRWYTVATGGTGSTIAPTPATATFGTTTYYVSQVNTTTNCESQRAAIVVNVSFVPNIGGSNLSHPTQCASATGYIELTGLRASYTFNVRYVKNGGAPVTVSLTSNTSGVIRISGLTAGAYTNITVLNNGCNSNSIGPINLIDPNPPPAPTPGTAPAICEGLALSLTASSTQTGITWNWTGPTGFTSTQQNP